MVSPFGMVASGTGFPRLYAAASLKPPTQEGLGHPRWRFSAALCRGLIEAAAGGQGSLPPACLFSAALCRGLIEAGATPAVPPTAPGRFPRLYAAASLKPLRRFVVGEAELRFPRLYAAASLKHAGAKDMTTIITYVFRGFMPRPH